MARGSERLPCGIDHEVVTPSTSSEGDERVRQCPSCGSQLADDARFCQVCGAEVSEGAVQWTDAPPPPPVGQAGTPYPNTPPQPPHGQQPAYGTESGPAYSAPPPPPNYLWQAIVVTLCCCWPLGIPAIVFAARVNGKHAVGDYAGAQQDSARAKQFTILALVLGFVVTAIYFVLVFIGALGEFA